jgi:acyl carrier protein
MNSVDDLCALIQQNLGDVEGTPEVDVRPDTPLLVSGLVDSLTIMKIITEVEQRSGVSFPETSIVASNFRTPSLLWTALQGARTAQAHENAV